MLPRVGFNSRSSSSSSSARRPSSSSPSQIHGQVTGMHAQIRNSVNSSISSSRNRDVFQAAPPSGPVNLTGSAPVRPVTPGSSPTPTATPTAAPAPTSAPSGSLDSTGDSAQVDSWISQAEQKMGRDFTAAEEDAIRTIAYYESRNDPSASNNFDANAQAGNPSQGLMQVTQSNFNTYNPGGNIFDPVDSIVAAVRYSDERYGGIDKAKGVVDLKNGGATDPYGGWNGGYTWY